MILLSRIGVEAERSQPVKRTLRPFQRDVAETLVGGDPVLLVAPTGFGKTMAALYPYLESARRKQQNAGADDTIRRLGTRLIYSLPLRAVAGGITEEFRSVAPSGAKMSVHHGLKPDSLVYREDAVVTTIDQYLTAFAGAPLSFSRSAGHAAAGATLASYSVFDEVHLLEPRTGLPLLAALLIQRQRWNLPSLLMTATLPRSVRDYLTDYGGLTIVEPSADEIARHRDERRRVTFIWEDSLDETDSLEKAISLQEEHGKAIWFVNRVDKAQRAYRGLRKRHIPALLLHSRFLPEHRSAKENALMAAFGRGSHWRGIVVSTQVSEAGLNISAPAVLSELAPADALVQRAGRCARFVPDKGTAEGFFHVYRPAPANDERPHLPYAADDWEATARVIPDLSGTRLTWGAEQDLVDAALSDLYGWYVRGEPPRTTGKGRNKKVQTPSAAPGLTPVDAIGIMERSYQGRSPVPVEQTLRGLAAARIVIRADIKALEKEIASEWEGKHRHRRRQLTALPITPWMLRRRVRQGRFKHKVYEINPAAAGKRADSGHLAPAVTFQPNGVYVVHPEDAGYSTELGLTWDGSLGRGETPWENRGEAAERGSDRGEFRSFEDHALGVMGRAGEISRLYRPFLRAWLDVFGADSPDETSEWVDQLERCLAAAALFHDVGKLSRRWQERIRQLAHPDTAPRDMQFIAKTPRKKATVGIPHAPRAFWFLRAFFGVHGEPDPLHDLIATAAARHHSIPLRDIQTGRTPEEIDMDVPGMLAGLAAEAFADAAGGAGKAARRAREAAARAFNPENFRGDEKLAVDVPSPSDDFYPLYTWVHRIVKIADWEDSAGKVVELPWLRSG